MSGFNIHVIGVVYKWKMKISTVVQLSSNNIGLLYSTLVY